MVICVVGRKNGNFYINRFPLFLIKVDISCMRQVNSSIAFFVHSLIFCNLFKFSLFTSCIFLFIFLLLEKRMLILNQKQRSKFVDQHLQRDPVLPRSIISLRGSVLSFLFLSFQTKLKGSFTLMRKKEINTLIGNYLGF